MVDRYTLVLKCAHCKEENTAVYAPTCSMYTFECKKCKKSNFIRKLFLNMFESIKTENVMFEDVKKAFLSSTHVSWSSDDIEEICKKDFKKIRGN